MKTICRSQAKPWVLLKEHNNFSLEQFETHKHLLIIKSFLKKFASIWGENNCKIGSKYRPKKQPESFFVGEINDEVKTGLTIAAQLLENAIVLIYSVLAFWQVKI